MRNPERGFMLLSAVFLTLITSLIATMLMNTNVKVHQRNSTSYLTAINLANEQFAVLENRAAEGNLEDGIYNFLGASDLESYNGIKPDSPPIKFEVKTRVEGEDNLKIATVTVKWTVQDEPNKIISRKTIRVSITKAKGYGQSEED